MRGGRYLGGGVGAALWGVADRGVGVLHAVLNPWPLVHVHIGDGEDALPIGAGNLAFIPVLVHSAYQRDSLPLKRRERFERLTCVEGRFEDEDVI